MISPPRPLELAATLIPVREIDATLEVLMVRRNAELSFGGMWTFPGGRIDGDDGPVPELITEADQDWSDLVLVGTAAAAAARELQEEVALTVPLESLRLFSHWIPPVNGPPRRFATWFFVSAAASGEIVVDTSENSEARWVEPGAALADHGEGNFPLATPTWITLHDLVSAGSVEAVVERLDDRGPNLHHTRLLPGGDGSRVLLWPPDAAYENGDLEAEGARNRVIMSADGTMSGRERFPA